jgi:hypothetical protein
MRADGTDVQQLTDNQWEEGTPAWRPVPRQTYALVCGAIENRPIRRTGASLVERSSPPTAPNQPFPIAKRTATLLAGAALGPAGSAHRRCCLWIRPMVEVDAGQTLTHDAVGERMRDDVVHVVRILHGAQR